MDRRWFLKGSLAILAALSAPRALARTTAAGAPASDAGLSNFRRIYLDPALRDRFFLFLQNVFHLYPEDRFHQLIIDVTAVHASDRKIYDELLARLPAIKPTLSELTYALPALRKQKAEMTRQTMEFLGATPSARGYLEIGSPARYVSALRGRVEITGPIWIVHDVAPSYAPSDLMERGGVAKIGTFVPMGNYDPFAGSQVPDASVELVTNFIGFHHCPADRLDGFVQSIRRVLRPGGRLLLRDHDVDRPEMDTFVALAHDVFNAGLFLPWEENHRQVRRFRSIRAWSEYLVAAGFRRSDRVLAQDHDPTRNLLLEFTKA